MKKIALFSLVVLSGCATTVQVVEDGRTTKLPAAVYAHQLSTTAALAVAEARSSSANALRVAAERCEGESCERIAAYAALANAGGASAVQVPQYQPQPSGWDRAVSLLGVVIPHAAAVLQSRDAQKTARSISADQTAMFAGIVNSSVGATRDTALGAVASNAQVSGDAIRGITDVSEAALDSNARVSGDAIRGMADVAQTGLGILPDLAPDVTLGDGSIYAGRDGQIGDEIDGNGNATRGSRVGDDIEIACVSTAAGGNSSTGPGGNGASGTGTTGTANGGSGAASGASAGGGASAGVECVGKG